jgi:hypothetical protein
LHVCLLQQFDIELVKNQELDTRDFEVIVIHSERRCLQTDGWRAPLYSLMYQQDVQMTHDCESTRQAVLGLLRFELERAGS